MCGTQTLGVLTVQRPTIPHRFIKDTRSHGPAVKLQAVEMHACVSVSGHNKPVMLQKY